ncbi:MAG: S26 family signal peptidase [Thermoguttaceae bacterium]
MKRIDKSNKIKTVEGEDAARSSERLHSSHLGCFLFLGGFLFTLGITACALLLRYPDLPSRYGLAPYSFRVQSRSMEPKWRGPRYYATCPLCEAVVVVSTDFYPSDDVAARASAKIRASERFWNCPYCGYDQVPTDSAVFEDGELLLGYGVKGRGRPPKRWDCVVFRDSRGNMTLKRLVGAPGERVELRNGDAWIDGVVARRDLAQLWDTAVEISPIVEEREDARLSVAKAVYTRDSLSSPPRAVRTSVTNESPIPCANGGASSATEFARDFFLRFNWDAEDGEGRFTILARRPERVWKLAFEPEQGRIFARVLPLRESKLAPDLIDAVDERRFDASLETVVRFPPFRPQGMLRVEVLTADGELIFVVNERILARLETGDLEDTNQRGVSTPFAILGDVRRASDMRLYRDLHYSQVKETGTDEASLDGYFVLGDNSPASRDSRFLEIGRVPVSRVFCVVSDDCCISERREEEDSYL